MSIQQDVLDCIGPSGVSAQELRGRLGNIAQNELDVCTNALMRSRKIALTFGRFELVGARSVQPEAPPNAQEEAAVSLLQPVSRVCVTCQGRPQALHKFRFVGPGDARAKECNTCHGKKTQAGQAKQRGKRAEPILFHSARKPTDNNGTEVLKVGHQTVNLAGTPPIAGSSPAGSTTPCDIAQSVEHTPDKGEVPRSNRGVATSSVNGGSGVMPTDEPPNGSAVQPDGSEPSPTSSAKSTQREGDNRDVSTEHSQQAAAVPETSGSYSRSDPSEDARTPASAERVSPVVESVLERVKARRQNALNRIVVLAVEVENLSAEVRDCERFVELWERFAGVQQ